jgi:hypothetical protein
LSQSRKKKCQSDVPPPLQAKGKNLQKSWDLFFSWARDFGVFDIDAMTITAGDDLAFVTAVMDCAGAEEEPGLSGISLNRFESDGGRKISAR